MSKKNKINTSDLTAVEVYKLVLSNKLKTFPRKFWDKPNSLKEAFKSNKLAGMLSIVFNGSPFLTINNAYPDKFKHWELKMCPIKFWNDDNRIKALKWLIEEKLEWSIEFAKKNLTQDFLIEYRLTGVLSGNLTVAELLQKAYLNEDFSMMRQGVSYLDRKNLEIDGKLYTPSEIANISGINKWTIIKRIQKGITGKDLLIKPKSIKNNSNKRGDKMYCELCKVELVESNLPIEHDEGFFIQTYYCFSCNNLYKCISKSEEMNQENLMLMNREEY